LRSVRPNRFSFSQTLYISNHGHDLVLPNSINLKFRLGKFLSNENLNIEQDEEESDFVKENFEIKGI